MNTTTAPADLFTRIGAIDLSMAPKPSTKISEHDVKIGVASENLQRIWSVHAKVVEKIKAKEKEFDATSAEHKALHQSGKSTNEDCTKYAEEFIRARKKIDALNTEANLLDEIFWRIVRFDFPELQEKTTIGIREGFELVWVKESPLDSPNPQTMDDFLLGGLLRVFFGGPKGPL